MIRVLSISGIFLLVLASMSASAQTAGELQTDLQQRLVGKMVTLRTPYAGEKLDLDQNMEVMNKAERGFRSVDAEVMVSSVRLDGAFLEITGNRVVSFYDLKTRGLARSDTQSPVKMRIELPGHNGTEGAVSSVLQKVFLSSDEIKQRQCSDEQRLEFEAWIAKSQRSKKRNKTDIQAGNSGTPQSHCFPTGIPVFLVAEGVKPPKAISTPDPQYTDKARKDRVNGTVKFAVAIDELGRPIDALLLSGLEPGLNYEALRTLQSWRFAPATLNGNPVPVEIKVEFNFSLR